MSRRFISVAEAELSWPGCTKVIRTMYTNGRLDGEDDPPEDGDFIFCVIGEDDWTRLAAGTLVYEFTGYGGIAWWEGSRWLYSNFGEVCCSGHWPEGPDHGVYEYLAKGEIGSRVR